MIFVCHCGRRFKRAGRRAKNCSIPCRDAKRLPAKMDLRQLRRFVAQGEYISNIARHFNVRQEAVAIYLRRHGLYEQWREQRFA